MNYRAYMSCFIIVGGLSLAGCAIEDPDPVVVATSAPAAATDADQVAEVAEAEPAAPATTEAPTGPAVPGDLVALGDWTVIVHGVSDHTDDLFPPSEGNRYVLLDVEVGYNGADATTLSTIFCFEVQDSTNRVFTEALVVNPVGLLDGDIQPGGGRRGGLVYEVPVDVAGLRLNFNCDLLAATPAVIALD